MWILYHGAFWPWIDTCMNSIGFTKFSFPLLQGLCHKVGITLKQYATQFIYILLDVNFDKYIFFLYFLYFQKFRVIKD